LPRDFTATIATSSSDALWSVVILPILQGVCFLVNTLLFLSAVVVIVVIWGVVYTRLTGKPLIVVDWDYNPADVVENVSLDSLQGSWQMVSIGRNGNFAPQHGIEQANIVMKIDGNEMRIVADQTRSTFTLNHDAVPNQMNQIADDGDEHLCIVRFRNHELEICQGEAGKPRPANFNANRRDGANLTRFKKIADSDADAGDADSATRHCFVLCRAAQPGDLSRAGKVVAEVFGPGYSAEVGDNKIVTINHGETGVGFLAHMPAPIPNGEAEENAARNFLWPGGREEAAKHRSHVIVTNMGGEAESPVESAIEVTRLALVALKLFDGTGVYWGNARVCNSRKVFEGFCADMSQEHMPVPMWLRFQPVRPSDNEFGIYTFGMRQFGLMDIEVDRSTMKPQELVEFVSNIAHYLIQSGPVIEDGNTVGGSEDERILVHHRPSTIEPGRLVYKIVFEG
jgi:uncharacterized protein (TIGR03067 family)